MIQSLAASMQTLWQRHEVIANNLANAGSIGFKADDLEFTRVAAQVASGGGTAGTAGAGWIPWTDFSEGPLQVTGRDLDVALRGPGFLVVDTPRGLRYTRAGALSIGREGFLVTSSGFRVLGERGPILVPAGPVSITEQGAVESKGRTLDTFRVVDFPRPYPLVKDGDGLFAPASPALEATTAAGAQVMGGALEGSNVNVVRTMVDMIETLRRYEAAQRAMQAADEAARYAANDMGRV